MITKNILILSIAVAIALTGCSKVARKAKQIQREEQKQETNSRALEQVMGNASCVAYEKARENGAPAKCFTKPGPSMQPSAPVVPGKREPSGRRK